MTSSAESSQTGSPQSAAQQPGVPLVAPAEQLQQVLTRYRAGESRSKLFSELVIQSLRDLGRDELTILDIGCGRGFDGNVELQRAIAAEATHSIGIEPDPAIPAAPHFSQVFQATLDDAPLVPGSVDVAYSCFVLEHIQHAEAFWNKLYDCLKPGGIFWGFTVDARHPFSIASNLLESLHLKDFYLDRLRGRRSIERYENYPTFYRMNKPSQVRRDARQFKKADFLSLHRAGQLDYYFPRFLWSTAHLAERLSMSLGLPGSVLVMRLEK